MIVRLPFRIWRHCEPAGRFRQAALRNDRATGERHLARRPWCRPAPFGERHGPGWFAGALLAGLVLAACGRTPEGNFSQRPGFARWYEANPPAATLPSPADQALLERYRPRFFLPAGNEGPLDFYRDYVAHGTLFGADGRELSSTVTQEDLNQVEREPHVVFVHEPAGAAPTPVVYGRVDRAPVGLAGCGRALPVTFLTYHLAFRTSGLPAGLPGWQEVLLGWSPISTTGTSSTTTPP